MRTVSRRQAIGGLFAAGTAVALVGPTAVAQARPVPPATVPNLGGDFLWGVASAGFPCEGHAPDSNWLRYVAGNPDFDPYGDAVDFFTHYRSDIALAAGLGARVYRISIEWARVQPRPGEWDEAGFAFYDSVLDAMAEYGLRPMLTLDHWVYPGWAADRGGWAHPDMVGDWLTNARKVVQRYTSRNPIWVTFNETAAYISNETGNGGLSVADVPVMQQRLV
ncbi:MAG: family 1 glycosylhydrolase, partial [Stackebrandtia sp.]